MGMFNKMSNVFKAGMKVRVLPNAETMISQTHSLEWTHRKAEMVGNVFEVRGNVDSVGDCKLHTENKTDYEWFPITALELVTPALTTDEAIAKLEKDLEALKEARAEELKSEVIYKRGDRFMYEEKEEYILARSYNTPYTLTLVSLRDGNIWNDGAEVGNTLKITKSHFDKVFNYDDKVFFEKIDINK